MGLAGYLYLFYGTERNLPDSTASKRVRSFAAILLPDEIVRSWWGNDVAQFGILDRIPILLVSAIILTLAYAAGEIAITLLRLRSTLTLLERVVFSVAIGLNSISLLTLAAGLAGQLQNRFLFLGMSSGNCRRLAVCVKRFAEANQSSFPSDDASLPPAEATGSEFPARTIRWAWLAVPSLACCLLGGILPPWQFDVREYHLQVPKEWFLAGRVEFLPHNVYGNMPLGAEILSIPGMVAMPGDLAWWRVLWSARL